jgi:hypothetical protein
LSRHLSSRSPRYSIPQNGLNPRPQYDARTRYGGILISADHPPLLTGGLLTADAELILDRCGILLVVGISGVQGDPGHVGISFSVLSLSLAGEACSNCSRHLASDEPGYAQYRLVYLGRFPAVAIIVCS